LTPTLGDTKIGINQDLDYNVSSLNHTNFSLNLSPSILFYLSERFLLGGGIEWLYVNKNMEDHIFHEVTDNSFVFYPSIRSYLHKGLFLQGQLDIGTSLYNMEANEVFTVSSGSGYYLNKSNKTSGLVYGFGIAGGYSIKLAEQILADVALKYIYHRSELDIESPRITEGTFRNVQSKIHFTLALRYQVKK